MSEEELEGVSPLAAPASRMKPARETAQEGPGLTLDNSIMSWANKAMLQRIAQRVVLDAETFLKDLWEIARVVAVEDSERLGESSGDQECPFCDGLPVYGVHHVGRDYVKHEETCIVSKARALIAEKKEHSIDGRNG